MVTEELGLKMPNAKHNPYWAGFLNGTSFFVSGLFPLLSYVLLINRLSPDGLLRISIVATLLCLFGLGAAKTKYSTVAWWRGGFEFCVLGGCCAFAAYMIGSIVAVTVGHSLPP
jgi:vacuolar iron transporter family protein